ncbi:MAG: hypothetical protein WBG95_07080 [Sulfitobacter sp.]
MTRLHLHIATAAALLSMGACTWLEQGPLGRIGSPDTPTAVEPVQEAEGTVTDSVLTAAPPPPPAANTQASLDTTSAAQRAEAAKAVPDATTSSLGTTIAGLGSPTEPGFWLKTPLVKSETTGRVTNTSNGKSSAVVLIPIDGPATGGSRLSLPAMRLIEATLTELVTLDVLVDG